MSECSLWFLSEMAVSDQHGSGVTVCRTLGRDLSDFAGLYCLADYHTIAGRFANRSQRWMPFFRTDFARRTLGCRLSDWCERRSFFETIYAQKCARRIHRSLPLNQCVKFLVSPQQTLCMRTLHYLRKLRKLEYATWVMDDNWVKYHEQENRWSYDSDTESLLREHLTAAQIVMTISDSMGQHYKDRFGIDYKVFFAPSPYDDVQPEAKFVPRKRLGYFGTLSRWPGDALARLAPHLDKFGYSLDIYSHHPVPPELKRPGVNFHSPIAPDQVQPTMKKYDAVVLPIGFTALTASYTHFNIATKMAECLGSGTATLAVGPSHAAMMQFLSENSLAIRVTEVTYESLADAFAKMGCADTRLKLIEQDLRFVKLNLSQSAVRQRWESVRDELLGCEDKQCK